MSIPRSRRPGAGVIAAALAMLSAMPAAAQDRAQTCAALEGKTVPAAEIGLPTGGAVVKSAMLVQGLNAPGLAAEFCRVIGAILPGAADAATGTPPIQFNLNLPSDWNGKAVHLGGGGYNGMAASGTLSVSHARGTPPLARGYATFASDSGHTGLSTTSDFASNDAALLNFAHEHIKKTHDAAFALIAAHYGRAPARSYFAGASTGGREGLTAVQRYPQDYDGVYVNAPAIYFYGMRLIGLKLGQQAYGAPGRFVSPEQFEAINAAATAACDGDDGAMDGIISDVAACKAKEAQIIAGLTCKAGGSNAPCLTPAQWGTVKALSEDFTLPYEMAYGVTSYPGYGVLQGVPIRGGLGMGRSPSLATPVSSTENGYLFAQGVGYLTHFVTRGEPFDPMTFDVTQPGKYKDRLVELSATIGAMNPDVEAFRAAGGKLLFTQGRDDEAVSADGSIRYYKQMVERYGQPATDAFVRFYVIPGFAHGGGNFVPSWEAVDVLDAWVEKGEAPERLVASDANAATRGRTRPLCRYPAIPVMKAGGDVKSAESFDCVTR